MHSKTIWPAFTADTNLSFCLPLHTQLKSFPQTVATHSHRHTNSFPVFPVTAASNLLTILQLFVCHWEQVSGFTRILHLEKTLSRMCYWVQKKDRNIKSTLQHHRQKKMFYKSIQSKLLFKKTPKGTDAPHSPTVWNWKVGEEDALRWISWCRQQVPPIGQSVRCDQSPAVPRQTGSPEREATLRGGSSHLSDHGGGQTLRDSSRHTWRQWRGVNSQLMGQWACRGWRKLLVNSLSPLLFSPPLLSSPLLCTSPSGWPLSARLHLRCTWPKNNTKKREKKYTPPSAPASSPPKRTPLLFNVTLAHVPPKKIKRKRKEKPLTC